VHSAWGIVHRAQESLSSHLATLSWRAGSLEHCVGYFVHARDSTHQRSAQVKETALVSLGARAVLCRAGASLTARLRCAIRAEEAPGDHCTADETVLLESGIRPPCAGGSSRRFLQVCFDSFQVAC
jgi:hypothetical protein